MKLYLAKNCYFVEGKKNAAIYDLNTKKVYSINEYGKILINAVLNGNDIELDSEELIYVNNLKSLNLLSEINNNDYNNKKISEMSLGLNFAWLELTEACNLRCVHCYGEFGKPIIDKEKMFSTEDWKNVIDKLYSLGCREIQLIGGEPMAHEGFREILNYAYDKGMKRIDVFTNATLINDDIAKDLKRCNASVRVSVYGHNPEVHDKITKGKGSFEKNKRGLELLKKYDIKTAIAVIIMKENEEYLEDIKKYIESLGHKYSGYDVIRPTCFESKQNHGISNAEILKKRYNIKPEFYTSEKSFIQNHFYNSCWNSKIAITSYGDIIPCIFARDDVVGNLKTDSIEKLRTNIIKKWKITKDNIEVCKDCEYRYCCHDCRPMAKGIYGKAFAKYPRCCYDPYKGEWINIEESTKELVNKKEE